MSGLSVYLPQDRLRALARGETLPDRTSGSALFADISGFTPLTEGLREALGSRRGGEELTKHLDAVYTALITPIEKYGGSVIDFAGDAILCWFDEALGGSRLDSKGLSDSSSSNESLRDPSSLAVTCAFAMQQAMQAFASIALPNDKTVTLSLKVTVASGAARRFIVGDPTIHLIDALAGATIARTSTAEHHAQKGDVIVDEATVNALRDSKGFGDPSSLTIKEWRSDDDTHERFAVVTQFSAESIVPTLPSTVRPPAANKLMAWLHQPVYEREQAGQESFLTEFRPCAALFVRFGGIDFEANEAQPQLDAFIRQTQAIVERYGGTFLQITIGDKGSYAYINFGVLTTHEDDARRAVRAAFDLKKAAAELDYLAPLQMGLTQGLLRVGAYGGKTRKTFGALGDEVNLAARLMMTAAPDEIVLSGHVHNAVEHQFSFEPRSPLPMKGKAEPLPVFAVTGARQQRAIRLQEPTYALPMVGRETELQITDDKLKMALQGQGQVIGIVAEAGMGKSRLVAEVIRTARKMGFVGYGGACQSDAINTPYQAWKSIWQAFFGVDPDLNLKKQMRFIEGEIEDRAPERVNAMPLLNIVLDLEIPDNDFTKTLEPQYRKSALRALLEDCLRAAAKDEPLLIVIEDLHWIDALSHDLLEELARDLIDSRVCFVLAYRPPAASAAQLETSHIESMLQFTKIEMHELNQAEAEQAIRAKLAQLYPARSGALPSGLVDKLMTRAQGNPFYLEELLNYVRDRGLDPADLNKIELPDSLHSLILSRIDQLSEREKNTLRVASIVGRLFRAEWLTGYYPDLGSANRVQTDLDQLTEMDLTALDPQVEAEAAYLFKHIITHEVTYESLPYATRAKLHEQLAAYLERQIAVGALTETFLLDTLVYHYERSDNPAKQCVYLKKAGDAALGVSAFNSALDYFTRLLVLTPITDHDHSALALQLATVNFGLGNFSAARAAVLQAQAAAQTDADRASALALLARITIDLGDYATAQTLLDKAVPLARASGDRLVLCLTLIQLGVLYYILGKPVDIRAVGNESLELARTLGDVTQELRSLSLLGLAATGTAEAEGFHKEVFTRAVAVGNRERAMNAVGNLGGEAWGRQEYTVAQDYTQQALALAREIGAQSPIALWLINQGYLDIKLGKLTPARADLREGLGLAQRLGALPLAGEAVMYFGNLAHVEGQTERALALFGLARNQPAWTSENQDILDTTLAEWALDPSVVEAGMKKGEELDWDITVQELLKG